MTATIITPIHSVIGDAATVADEHLPQWQRDIENASARARIWGTPETAPLVGNRRMVAVGYSDFHGVMVSTGPHPQATDGQRGYDYFPHYGYGF